MTASRSTFTDLTASLTTTDTAIDHILTEGVGRTLGDRRVLTDVSLTVSPGERVGLIGENGAGKSTLLRLVAGRDTPDVGVVRAPARVGLLWQEPPFAGCARVLDVLDDALAEARRAVTEIEDAATAVAAGLPGSPERLTAALDTAERTDAWAAGARRGEVLAGLGLEHLDQRRRVDELSSGQCSRLALAALLLARPTALLLDEPTNHLDDASVDFLHTTLLGWSGPVLFASHDRELLARTATRILDLDPSPRALADAVAGEAGGSGHGVRSFRGGYVDHLAERHRLRERWQQRYDDQQEELQRLRDEIATKARQTNRSTEPRTEGRIMKKFYADRDARVTSRRVRHAYVQLDRLSRAQVHRPPDPLSFAGLAAPSRPPTTRALVAATRVAVSGRLAPVSVTVTPSDRLLVTGPNGAGKSTLLHVLHGSLHPTGGTVRRPTWACCALLAQDVDLPRPDRSARELYADALGEHRAEAVPLADLGLLAGPDLDRPVGVLSVGQRRRVALALVIARPPHLLLLDEPTNHLALSLVDELEEALGAYPGAVVMASHDRWLRARWDGAELPLRGATA